MKGTKQQTSMYSEVFLTNPKNGNINVNIGSYFISTDRYSQNIILTVQPTTCLLCMILNYKYEHSLIATFSRLGIMKMTSKDCYVRNNIMKMFVYVFDKWNILVHIIRNYLN